LPSGEGELNLNDESVFDPGTSIPDEVAGDAIVDDVLAEVQLGKTRRKSTS